MNESRQLSLKLTVAARRAWARHMSDCNDLEVVLNLSDLPRYFLQLCALASLIEMPGVERLYDKMRSKLTEIALVPALAELSADKSLTREEQLVLAGVNTFLWRMRVKRSHL